MNEAIQSYIEKRKVEIPIEHEREKQQLLEKLKIGKRVFSGKSTASLEYPLLIQDTYDQKSYKIDVAEGFTDEDYEELLKYVPNKDKEIKSEGGKSFWYFFGIILMLVGIVAGVYLAGTNPYERLTGVAISIGSMVFFSQMILLAKIEYNTREKK